MRDGLLLVDKDPGGTSHDVVQAARRLLRQKKIGHCGTLDPEATGLLLLTLGHATRLTRFLIRAPKVYAGVIRFGVATDTYDAAGRVVEEIPCEDLSAARIAAAMAEFEGTLEQRAPSFSAKKVGGKKLYELARRGEEVPVSSKEVTIFEFTPQSNADCDAESQAFRLSCTSGTYARSLAHDLGQKLGCGAHLASLRRLQIGPFQIDNAIRLADLADHMEADDDSPIAAWVPFDGIPLPFEEITVDSQQQRRIAHGQTVLLRRLECEEGDWVKLVDQRQRFIAVGSVVERIGNSGAGVVRPRIVFK